MAQVVCEKDVACARVLTPVPFDAAADQFWLLRSVAVRAMSAVLLSGMSATP